MFVVQDLKPLDADRDYQLWVIDKTPVVAGVFHVDANGRGRFRFKTKALFKAANKFAVIQEGTQRVALPDPVRIKW